MHRSKFFLDKKVSYLANQVNRTTDKVKWGPASHCMGFGPGSGTTCFNIPQNCFIMIPLDNTIPYVFCSNGGSQARPV